MYFENDRRTNVYAYPEGAYGGDTNGANMDFQVVLDILIMTTISHPGNKVVRLHPTRPIKKCADSVLMPSTRELHKNDRRSERNCGKQFDYGDAGLDSD